MGEDKIFTKTNLIISGITISLFLLKFFEMLYLDKDFHSAYSWDIYALIILIILIYTIFWAYLSRYIGLKKGFEKGYVWGYCLGIIGFMVVCTLKEDDSKLVKSNDTNINQYDEIEKLQQLKISGVITEEEFEIEKQKLLR